MEPKKIRNFLNTKRHLAVLQHVLAPTLTR
jgi:hypothetical protein